MNYFEAIDSAAAKAQEGLTEAAFAMLSIARELRKAESAGIKRPVAKQGVISQTEGQEHS